MLFMATKYIMDQSKYHVYSRRFSGDFSQKQRRHTTYVAVVFAEKDRKDTGIKIDSLYMTIPPRLRGGSPKEIQQSNKGISFGEKGAPQNAKIFAEPTHTLA